MRKLPYLFVSSVLLVASGLAICGTALTDRSVRTLVDANEESIRLDQFDQSNAFISDDCTARNVMMKEDGSKDDKTQSCRQATEEGRKVIGEVNASGTTHTYASTVTSIVIEGAKATAQLHVVYKLARGEHRTEIDTDEVETVQLRNGKPLITAVVETQTAAVVDGRRISAKK